MMMYDVLCCHNKQEENGTACIVSTVSENEISR
jgi:hypothetical protein